MLTKNRLIALVEEVRASYWFVPAVMLVLSIILSQVVVAVDQGTDGTADWVSALIYVNSTNGARAILETIASSMITVAGVVFSLTMVVLSLTAQEYSSLVLPHLLRDRGNQIVLGTFLATFMYSVLVLRTIHEEGETIFVPHLSVLVSILLAVASVAVLIYYIHHVSDSIRASTIISRLSDQMLAGLDDLFPRSLGRGLPESIDVELASRVEDDDQKRDIVINEDGYLQLIDEDALFNIARDHNLTVEIGERPGAFLIAETRVARAWPVTRVDDDVAKEIAETFTLGARRSGVQDAEYLMDQIVAVAVRALSPGINAPSTAILAIDRLGQALSRLARRGWPSHYRFDDDGVVRVVAQPVAFETLLNRAFDAIRHYGSSDPDVSMRLIETLGRIHHHARDNDRARAAANYAALVYREAVRHIDEPTDRDRLDAHYRQTFDLDDAD